MVEVVLEVVVDDLLGTGVVEEVETGTVACVVMEETGVVVDVAAGVVAVEVVVVLVVVY